jgi:hypothetical protein
MKTCPDYRHLTRKPKACLCGVRISDTETKCRHCQDIERRRRDAAQDQREQHA